MSIQLDIFAPPAQRHSVTSMEAAEAIKPKVTGLRARVLAYLNYKGSEGATDEEIQDALSMNPSTQRPRRIELVRGGYIEGPEGLTRKTSSGRKAQVWRVA